VGIFQYSFSKVGNTKNFLVDLTDSYKSTPWKKNKDSQMIEKYTEP
jgi:hypothetical protein